MQRTKSKNVTRHEVMEYFAKELDDRHKMRGGPTKYMVVRFQDGQGRLYIVSDDLVLTPCHEDKLKYDLQKMSRDHKLNSYRLMPKQINDVATFYMRTTPRCINYKDVKAWTFADETAYTFHKTNWSPSPGPTPLWDELMSRVIGSESLMAFIGSLNDEKSYRQQYIWQYGSGSNGKGCVMRAVTRMMGTAHVSKNIPAKDKNYRFFRSNLENVRLVTVPDTNNPCFPRSGFFKEMTGDDAVELEKKYQDSITVYLKCKFMFNSNKMLDIGTQEADRRRALPVKYLPVPPGAWVEDYESKLWKEMPHFIYNCIEEYTKIGPNKRIPANEDLMEEALEMQVMEFMRFWCVNFEWTKTSNNFLRAELVWDRFLSDGKTNKANWHEYLDFLQDRFGIKKTRPIMCLPDEEEENSDDFYKKRLRGFRGLSLRGAFLTNDVSGCIQEWLDEERK